MIPTAKPTASNNELPKPRGFSRSWHRWLSSTRRVSAGAGGGNPTTDGKAGSAPHPRPSLCVWMVPATREGLSHDVSADTEKCSRDPQCYVCPMLPKKKKPLVQMFQKIPTRLGQGQEGSPQAESAEILGFPAANLCFPGNRLIAGLLEPRCPVAFQDQLSSGSFHICELTRFFACFLYSIVASYLLDEFLKITHIKVCS